MIRITTQIERWELNEPFVTARDSATHVRVLVAILTDQEGARGWGEAAGVDYDGETPESMAAQITGIGARLHDDITGSELMRLLPAGGARNALDCALWDLRAKQTGVPAWQAAGLAAPQPIETAFTLGLGDEADTRRKARAAILYPLLKLKVDAQRHLDIVRIVREEHPRARLIVDANQAWSRPQLERLLPQLHGLGVELVEQPVPRGDDAALDGLDPLVPLAADESCTDLASIAALAGRYQYLNFKLDKCGGLTEALAMCAAARSQGFGLMVGNMCGTSLAMAPAFLIARSCRYVDLDGPLLQRQDRTAPIRFTGGLMHPPEPALWG